MHATAQAQAHRLTWTAALGFVLLANFASGQGAVAWKTGPAFRKQLDDAVSIAWSERPLREALAGLSQTVGVAIFLERRIDPGQMVAISVRDQPLKVALAEIAARAGAGSATIGSVVYLGPVDTAARLATLAEIRRQEASKLPGEAKSRLLRSDRWQWDELAQPRLLLADLARQASVTIENPEAIPHDLWPAASLPPLPWTDRLSLLTAGFGLTFEIAVEGSRVRIVPIPEQAILERTYTTRGLAQEFAGRLRPILPGVSIRVEQGKVVVAGSLDDHEKVERLLAGQSVRTPNKAKGKVEKEYSLEVIDKPAGAVLRTIATQLGKELKYDAAVLEKLKQNVKFTADKVSLDELLTMTLKPLALRYRLTDDALEIIAE